MPASLITYYESCSIKIKQTPGNYEWDEHYRKAKLKHSILQAKIF